MANEVVNPFQTFRNDPGVPLSGGSLRILQPGTDSLATAFSDDALTIPQVVDGYRLDQYGRVTGDLKWNGTRDVEVFDANGAFIRRNPNVVTLFDASVFAINVASVPAMIANTTLVVGDVVETQSYNAGQGYGGARYLIVAAATGTDDGYTFHDLINGLQARLIDVEKHNNFYVAGAIGDGVANDSVFVQRVLDIGGDVECANGTFAVASLTVTKDAAVFGNGSLLLFPFAGGNMFTLTGVDLRMTFDGVTLDGNLANQVAALETALIRGLLTASAATTISQVTFNNVTFKDASRNDVWCTSDDTGFPVLYTLAQCSHLGGEQSTDANITASVRMEDGAAARVEDCYFDLVNTLANGRCAVESRRSDAAAVVNPGYLSVTANTMVLMGVSLGVGTDSRGAINAMDVSSFIAHSNRILTPTAAGIVFRAEVDRVSVVGNTINGLGGTNTLLGGVVAIATANAAAGNNWQIDTNEILGVGAAGIWLIGTSAGAAAARVSVANNLINAPTLQGILIDGVEDPTIEANQVNMNGLADVNAIEIGSAAAGIVNALSNQIYKTAGTGIGIVSADATAAKFFVDGNVLDSVTDGVSITNAIDAFLTNNVFSTISGKLMVVGTLTNCLIEGNSNVGGAPAAFAQNLGSITNLVVGENFWTQLDDSIRNIAVTGANITAGPVVAHYQRFIPTGATSIDTLNAPGIDGYQVVCQGDGVAAVTFNNALGNLRLGAATRILTDVNDTLTLVWNQTNSFWAEVSYSNN